LLGVCDDSGSDGPEDEQPNDPGDEPESLDEMLADLARELFGNMSPETHEDDYERPDGDERPEDAPPRPGERVLYALGQLHRLHLAGQLPVSPSAFSIEDVARIVGVVGDLEFSTEDRHGQSFHFPNEVLDINAAGPFPWRLLGVWEWAAERQVSGPEGRD
jgi:hypothetical protein